MSIDLKRQEQKQGVEGKRPLSQLKNQFGNVALRYYPDHGYKSAIRLFRREFELTLGLLPALEAVGYRQNQRILSPRMVQVIEDYLGPMD